MSVESSVTSSILKPSNNESKHNPSRRQSKLLPSLQDSSSLAHMMNFSLYTAQNSLTETPQSSAVGIPAITDTKDEMFLREWDHARKDQDSDLKTLLTQVDGMLVNSSGPGQQQSGISALIHQLSQNGSQYGPGLGSHQSSTDRTKRPQQTQTTVLYQKNPYSFAPKRVERAPLYVPPTEQTNLGRLQGKRLNNAIESLKLQTRQKSKKNHETNPDGRFGGDDSSDDAASRILAFVDDQGQSIDEAPTSSVMEMIYERNDDEKRQKSSVYDRILYLTTTPERIPSMNQANEENQTLSERKRMSLNPPQKSIESPLTRRSRTSLSHHSTSSPPPSRLPRMSLNGDAKAAASTPTQPSSSLSSTPQPALSDGAPKSLVPRLKLGQLTTTSEISASNTLRSVTSLEQTQTHSATARLPPITSRDVLHPNERRMSFLDQMRMKRDPTLPLALTSREFTQQHLDHAKGVKSRFTKQSKDSLESKLEKQAEDRIKDSQRSQSRAAFLVTSDEKNRLLHLGILVHTVSRLAIFTDTLSENRSRRRVERQIARIKTKERVSVVRKDIAEWRRKMRVGTGVIIRCLGQMMMQQTLKARREFEHDIKSFLSQVRQRDQFTHNGTAHLQKIYRAQLITKDFLQCQSARIHAANELWARVEYKVLHAHPSSPGASEDSQASLSPQAPPSSSLTQAILTANQSRINGLSRPAQEKVIAKFVRTMKIKTGTRGPAQSLKSPRKRRETTTCDDDLLLPPNMHTLTALHSDQPRFTAWPLVGKEKNRSVMEIHGEDEAKKQRDWVSIVPVAIRQQIIIDRLVQWRKMTIHNIGTAQEMKKNESSSASAVGSGKKSRRDVSTIPLFPFYGLLNQEIKHMILQGMEATVRGQDGELEPFSPR
ncbi:hypothetical protein BLNAU_7966 [Blattamonas nauphoetae]|uniref:Uncharacterized protein n=1 Tax=Blattamonas nauphoetae TaxID=2049346 RepID=A0ABQ9Y072_9EUKA|nr:hypothetical protein BLNAU_7966 [Blattamonas nauphoetae]